MKLPYHVHLTPVQETCGTHVPSLEARFWINPREPENQPQRVSAAKCGCRDLTFKRHAAVRRRPRLDLTSRSPELTPSTACAGLADPGLEAIGEIIHDIDLKDANFDSDEASGIALIVKGIVTSSKDDAKQLERGATVSTTFTNFFGPRECS